MSSPKVTVIELDGALGVLPPSFGALPAYVGVSSTGPLNTPATFGRVQDLVTNFGTGPLVEAAAHEIQRYGNPVVVVRTGNTVAGTFSAIDDSGVTGTSVASLDTVSSNDDYEATITVVHGGTIGSAGITLTWSLDGGRTPSAVTALGTANHFAIPTSGGVNVLFAAGTLVAGDVIKFVCVAPNWNDTELDAGLTALGASSLTYDPITVVGPVGSGDLIHIDTAVAGLAAVGKPHFFMCNTRMPTVGETESTYLSSLSTAFASSATLYGAVCAGADRISSSVSGRTYRRPVVFAAAAREASLEEQQDSADVNLGGLPVAITDSNGNPVEHDELNSPGLDDARFYTLRTWNGIQGVYVNRPRIMSPNGSDFQLIPHRRVLNIAHVVIDQYMIRRLNQPVQVDKTTGFILESEAKEIENGGTAVLRAALLTSPKASDVTFILSRFDNLLSTKTLHGDVRVVPLAYPENVVLSLGFSNPSLQIQAQ